MNDTQREALQLAVLAALDADNFRLAQRMIEHERLHDVVRSHIEPEADVTITYDPATGAVFKSARIVAGTRPEDRANPILPAALRGMIEDFVELASTIDHEKIARDLLHALAGVEPTPRESELIVADHALNPIIAALDCIHCGRNEADHAYDSPSDRPCPTCGSKCPGFTVEL